MVYYNQVSLDLVCYFIVERLEAVVLGENARSQTKETVNNNVSMTNVNVVCLRLMKLR